MRGGILAYVSWVFSSAVPFSAHYFSTFLTLNRVFHMKLQCFIQLKFKIGHMADFYCCVELKKATRIPL